jgi:hypothetical protein
MSDADAGLKMMRGLGTALEGPDAAPNTDFGICNFFHRCGSTLYNGKLSTFRIIDFIHTHAR